MIWYGRSWIGGSNLTGEWRANTEKENDYLGGKKYAFVNAAPKNIDR